MISILKKTNSAHWIISYNESKVEQGKAELIYNTLPAAECQDKIDLMEMNASLNERLRKNKFIHQVISFSAQDQVGEEQFLKILEDHHNELGLINHNMLIYKHWDTDLEHYHIVTPTVDTSGKKYSDFNDHKINRDICRRLEVKYNLEQVKYESKGRPMLNERNAIKYSIYNYVRTHEDKALPEEMRHMILTYKLSNASILSHLPAYMSKRDIDRFLIKTNQAQPIKKEILIQQLKKLKSQAGNVKEFERLVKDQGLYIRKVRDKNGFTFVYGEPSSSTYLREQSLPKDLKYQYLYKEDRRTFTLDDQKKFLKTIVGRSSYKSTSFQEFENHLLSYNVSIQYHSDKRGIYGYSVKSNNVPGGDWIGGASLSEKLSFSHLAKKIAFDPITQAQISKQIATQARIKTVSRMLNLDKEIQDEEYKRQQQEGRSTD